MIRGVGSQHAESKWISRRAAMTGVGSAKSMAVEANEERPHRLHVKVGHCAALSGQLHLVLDPRRS